MMFGLADGREEEGTRRERRIMFFVMIALAVGAFLDWIQKPNKQTSEKTH